MATWLYPPAFEETFRCDYCECDFSEDDLTEYERDKWACDACAAQHIEPEEPMKRTPRALTHEIRWLLGLGFVACIAGMMGLWLITRGMW